MAEPWIVATLAALVILVVLAAVLLWRSSANARESARDATEMRTRLDAVGSQIANVERDVRQDLANARAEQGQWASGLRGELATSLDAVRSTVEHRLDAMRTDNAAKLEQMRAIVDERLQATLEKRLGESFRLVSERLEQVQRGLGEMQSLAVGVGDLKRVLGNVKTRGTWGEVQLAALLAEALTPQQYATNVEIVPGSNQRVEFALRLPGHGDSQPCWIPIDSKFPLDEWQRLQEALENADAGAAEAARRAIAEALRVEAKKVRLKYVVPPFTTEFAILFVPTEGLYAEIMARPGVVETMQREHRVMLCGPTNLLALLNSLQLGFRTLAIQQRSNEVWGVLNGVRSEFQKFGEVLVRAQRKLQEAANTIDEARGKTTTISRKLRDVEALPEHAPGALLDTPSLFDGEGPGSGEAK